MVAACGCDEATRTEPRCRFEARVDATRETVCSWASSTLVDVDSFTMDTSRKVLRPARARLRPEAWDAAAREGACLTFDEAISYAPTDAS